LGKMDGRVKGKKEWGGVRFPRTFATNKKEEGIEMQASKSTTSEYTTFHGDEYNWTAGQDKKEGFKKEAVGVLPILKYQGRDSAIGRPDQGKTRSMEQRRKSLYFRNHPKR